jgi:adenosylmethionine-8-amino-7-oxononanoate aminotransferase
MQPVKIVRAVGNELHTGDGQRILDAAGGAIAANVGHGRAEVADAIAEAARECSYAVPPWLTPQREHLLERLQGDWLPPHLTRMHLTCGGSEGVETAMKIALQYQAARGKPDKTKIIGRAPSYHGTTLATAAVGGHPARRRGLERALPTYPHVPAPYALRCAEADVTGYCLRALEDVVEREGAASVAALLAEPIVGASGGALVPPDDYWPRVRELCDMHDILLLADEVMTGFGRTGTAFGLSHWSVPADVMVAGKGLAGGYAPITGVFATEAVGAAIEAAGLNVMFHTFAAHPTACAAADAVLRILAEEDLVARAASTGAALQAALDDAFREHPHVAEVRGRGLLLALELVADRETLERYPEDARVTSRVTGETFSRGVAVYPGGTGEVRDIVVLGPPFTLSEGEAGRIVEALVGAVKAVTEC